MGQGVYLLLSVSFVEIVCSSGTFLIRCLQSFARFRRYFNDCLSKNNLAHFLGDRWSKNGNTTHNKNTNTLQTQTNTNTNKIFWMGWPSRAWMPPKNVKTGCQLCGTGLRIPRYHVLGRGVTLCKSRARHPTQRRYGPGSYTTSLRARRQK